MKHVFLIFAACIACAVQPLQAQTLTGFDKETAAFQAALEKKVLEWQQNGHFRRHLEALTSDPHIAGTPESEAVVRYLAETMQNAGLDVEIFGYDVLLPQSVRNEVFIVSPVQMKLNNLEMVHDEDPYSSDERLFEGWNAYSGSGDVTGQVVYVNQGTKADFERLAEMGVDLKGKIGIARYGGNFRGYKAKYAEAAGMIGLVIYTDPSAAVLASGEVYPAGRNPDATTIQRGSLLTLDYTGDPLTPFEPALPLDDPKSPERMDPSDVAFHQIPVLPLPYGSAIEILSRMGGNPVPDGWKGGLDIEYRMGGTDAVEVRVVVDQPYEMTRIENVIGTLEGDTYPDEYILLGCHHDAWSFGTTDPNSGTAMLLMVAEILGELKEQGIRPKRSIKIGHWDAEEFFIIGSSEYVEQFREDLAANAIAYLNADMSVTGFNFSSSSAPLLKQPIIDATKAVPYSGTSQSVYEHWLKEAAQPNIGNLGGGSDHVGFYTHAGVPSAGMNMSGSVPVYHSNYDNLHWYEKFASAGFTHSQDLAKVFTVLSLRMANAEVIPYDVPRYYTDITNHTNDLKKRAEAANLQADWSNLDTRLAELNTQTQGWSEFANATAAYIAGDNGKVVTINRLLRSLEQSFIVEEGMPYARWHQSLYASPDPYSGYASWMMPGIRFEVEERNSAGVQHEVDRLTAALERVSERVQQIKTMGN